MAGDWIKVDITLPDKPEVDMLADLLGMEPDTVVGKLIRVWAWANQHTLDGHAVTVTASGLDRRAHCEGFAAAMRKAGWLEGRDGALTFPRFERHNGQTAKARLLARERKVRERSRSERDEIVTPRGQRREEKNINTPPTREAGEPAVLGASRAQGSERTHLPPTAEAAERSVPNAGIPASFLRDAWMQVASRGGKDGAGQTITNWALYVTRRWEREKNDPQPRTPNHGPNSKTPPGGSSRNNSQSLRDAAKQYGQG